MALKIPFGTLGKAFFVKKQFIRNLNVEFRYLDMFGNVTFDENIYKESSQ